MTYLIHSDDELDLDDLFDLLRDVYGDSIKRIDADDEYIQLDASNVTIEGRVH